MAGFDARSSYQDRLLDVPPPARRILAEDQIDRAAAEKLVYAVTGGDPPSVIASLV